MPSDPIIIISASDDPGPANPVRIVNWNEFIYQVGLALSLSPIFDKIRFNLAFPAPAFQEGSVYWDAVDRTLAIMQGSGIGGVTQQVGQETNAYVRNDSGVDIPDGAACYVTGSVGNRPSVALAIGNDIFKSRVHCVATQAIPHNGNGFVTTFGIIRNIDTQTPGWAEGDFLYLSPTVAGLLINTPPVSGFNNLVGICLKVSVGAGMIFVCPQYLNYFGSAVAGNYTQFEWDGTMRAVGGATCWRDELQSVTGAQIDSPAGDFQRNNAEGSVTAKASAAYPADFIITNHQLNHDWTNGTSIHPHLHWWQTSANVPNWLIGYRWQKEGAAKTTAWSNLPWTSNQFVYAGGTLNQITELGIIAPPVGFGQVSDIVQFRLYRDVANASGLFGGPEVAPINQDIVNFDTHINVDTLGSRQEYIK